MKNRSGSTGKAGKFVEGSGAQIERGEIPVIKTKIRAYRDFLWLKVLEETKINGIIIPQSAQDIQNPLEGVVVAVGDGLVEGGVVVPLTARMGDHVHFPRNVGTFVTVKETDETFFVCRENILFGATS